MIIEQAKCGGYKATYHGVTAYGRTMTEALLEMYNWRLGFAAK